MKSLKEIKENAEVKEAKQLMREYMFRPQSERTSAPSMEAIRRKLGWGLKSENFY